MKLLIVLVAVLALSEAANISELKEWNNFKLKFSKKYASREEHDLRFQIFKANLQQVRELNMLPEENATFGVTKFMDLTATEFKKFLGYVKPDPSSLQAHEKCAYNKTSSLPSSFDWRNKKDIVTPVKNQGQCGSCWAFSTVETIESAWAKAGHQLEKLSVAQIVDCDHEDAGCNGGDTKTAYEYVKKAGGLESEKNYPYHPYDGSCHFKKKDVVASISGYCDVLPSTSHDEKDMQHALMQTSPLSVCVDAASWQFYTSGVLTSHCGKQLDHCVQITGFGEQSGIPYWAVRNSWAADWGIKGYIRIVRNKDLCGIATEVTLPIIS